MTDAMIYTNNLTKSFGDNLAVDRLSLSIPKGGFALSKGLAGSTVCLIEPEDSSAWT